MSLLASFAAYVVAAAPFSNVDNLTTVTPTIPDTSQISSSRVNTDYPEDFFVSSVFNRRQMVYGTLWNNTNYTVRNVRVRARVGYDNSLFYEEYYIHNGIFSPGTKIEIPVRVQSAPPDHGLNYSTMEIMDFTVD